MGGTEARCELAPADAIVAPDEVILVTGASGFIGPKVVEDLLRLGFRNLRCLVRTSSRLDKLEAIRSQYCETARIEFVQGNLLSREDCAIATKGAALVYHLAAARGEKSFPDAFMNSVVTTRNLIEASRSHGCLKRFVSVSSFSVYSNQRKRRGRLLHEPCPLEIHPENRGDAYSFAKVKQDELVAEYGAKFGMPFLIVRPGVVYRPGNEAITGRVGLGTFGIFLHLGGSNPVPLTYVDNCAEAIVLAGLKPGVDGEVFNVVDDELPSSRRFLGLYKKNVKRFPSVYVPHAVSYLLCWLWEKYSDWSEGQLPPVFNRTVWHAYWKSTRYSNEKIKNRLGWNCRVSPAEALNRHFESCRTNERHA